MEERLLERITLELDTLTIQALMLFMSLNHFQAGRSTKQRAFGKLRCRIQMTVRRTFGMRQHKLGHDRKTPRKRHVAGLVVVIAVRSGALPTRRNSRLQSRPPETLEPHTEQQ